MLKEKNKIVNKFRVVGWLIGVGLNATVHHGGRTQAPRRCTVAVLRLDKSFVSDKPICIGVS